MVKKNVLIIHGPNLNLLGQREVDIYGKTTIKDIDNTLKAKGKELGINVETYQSNHEGGIVDTIGSAKEKGYSAILINPAAYTHTSIAIREAITACGIPCVEAHLSNIYAREDFRHTSLIAPACKGQLSGFGIHSYTLGLEALRIYLD